MLPIPLLVAGALAYEFPTFEMQEISPRVGNVCYAVATADVNGDGRPDVVAVTEDAVVWFENPTWEPRDIIRGATARDNVCLQPSDIDGDGRVDFALGASWQPTNTKGGGTLQWLGREPGSESWKVYQIGEEPTLHRLRWGDVLGAGKDQLVVAPLQGRGTKGPNWGEGAGARILVYSVPAKPAAEPWPLEVADESLHTVHNLELVDFDGDGRREILLGAWEGVFLLKKGGDGRWSRRQLGSGDQQSKPFRGSSEIKLGRNADGSSFLATLEPWHGDQFVIYRPGPDLWQRQVVDKPLSGGHAVWVADLNGDKNQDVIVGHREPSADPGRKPRGPGLIAYEAPGFAPRAIDDGGIAVEDAAAADLDGDGRPEIIAGGRSTHNVRIYWNRPKSAR